MSFLIRISTDRCLFATPRSFSQLVTSFFGAMYQGILLYALCSLIFFRLHFCNPSNFTFSLQFFDFNYSTIFVNRFLRYFFRINLISFLVFLLFCLIVLIFKSFSIDISFLIYLSFYYAVVNLLSFYFNFFR